MKTRLPAFESLDQMAEVTAAGLSRAAAACAYSLFCDKFYVELRIQLEGGKITPITRARVMLKRMMQRLSRK
jgi:hypothetical protein